MHRHHLRLRRLIPLGLVACACLATAPASAQDAGDELLGDEANDESSSPNDSNSDSSKSADDRDSGDEEGDWLADPDESFSGDQQWGGPNASGEDNPSSDWLRQGEQPAKKEDVGVEPGQLEQDEALQFRGPGQDTVRIYRAEIEKVEDLPPGEEALAWERYLKKYPNSVFKERIQARIDALQEQMYDERIEDRYRVTTEDAGKAELNFAQPMLLESIDPRSKLRVGFEWGYPEWINLTTDLEYQIFRELSVHGGIHRRYTGWNIEAGGHYALVKSARTHTLVSLIGDLHANANPMFPGFRPELGVGQRFNLSNVGFVDAQAQLGSDLVLVNSSAGGRMLDPRLVGGANITVAPSHTVRAYVETSLYMKDLFWDQGGPFLFDVVTFGLKFVNRKSVTQERFEAGVGASAPYARNYWAYHYGSVTGELDYFY